MCLISSGEKLCGFRKGQLICGHNSFDGLLPFQFKAVRIEGGHSERSEAK